MSSEFWKYTGMRNLPNEVWLDVKDYPNYQVSSYGRVKSRINNIILKQRLDKDGYCKVDLNSTTKRVNRLVATTFIHNDNPLTKTHVNHINEIKTDNTVDNLDWVTPKENNNHGTHNQRVIETKKKNGTLRTGMKPVYCTETDTVYDSIKDAAKATGKDRTGIARCCRGEYKQTGGYHFEFDE